MKRANKTLASLLVTLCLFLVSPASASSGTYVAGDGVIIWCSAEEHGVLSGEPECAAADVDNDVRELNGDSRVEHGYGGFAFASRTGSATISLDDGLGTAGFVLHGEMPSGNVEACGSYAGPVSTGLNWVSVPPVLVTEGLDACLATTGSWSVVDA